MPDIFKQSAQNPTNPAKSENSPKPTSQIQPAPKVKTPISPPPQSTTNQNPLAIFTTFIKNPSGVSYAGQDPDEEIALFLRRDFGTNTPWILSTIVLIIIPLLIRFIFRATNTSFPYFQPNFIRMFTVFYYFVVAGFAFSNFLTWFFTIGMVTNKRALDIDFVDISSIKFATADLSDIIDAKYTQNGFGQSFFDYGDVDLIVQTPKEKLSFEKVPRPSEVSNVIDDLTGIKRNA